MDKQKRYQVSDIVDFVVVQSTLIPHSEVKDLLLAEEVSDNLRTFEPEEQKELIEKIKQQLPPQTPIQFLYKITELSNVTKTAQIALIADAFNLRLNQTTLAALLEIVK